MPPPPGLDCLRSPNALRAGCEANPDSADSHQTDHCRTDANPPPKEDFLNPGLRGCAGVNYALLVRAPLERLVSHIQFAKFSPAHVDEWSRGGKATGNIAHESYTVRYSGEEWPF